MGNLFLTANMRNILHSISNIQHTIMNFMIRLDTKGNHMEEMTKQISGTYFHTGKRHEQHVFRTEL